MNVAKHWHVAGEVFAISDCLVINVSAVVLMQRVPYSDNDIAPYTYESKITSGKYMLDYIFVTEICFLVL